MNRRAFLRTAAGLVPALAVAARRPNIVLIVADDLGYGELGVQGLRDVPTPHIDSIARNGVRFTNGYVSCPVCSPTRAGLMTGRYQQRFGHEFNPGPAERAESNFGLPLTETTIPQRLKPLGYSTGMVGKWHLGYRPELHPLERGFDEFFGFLGGAHPYVRGGRVNEILRGTKAVEEPEYLTEAFAREAVSYIERHQKETFFLYLTFNAVHAPMQAAEKYLARFSSMPDPRRRTYAGMLSALDDGVGRVLGKLRDARLEDDTVIAFVSDNGGPTLVTTSANGPLRGLKGQVLEGGIRVPFLLQGKGRLPAGKVYGQPVIALDLHPTLVAAAGGTIPASAKLDGVNLTPYLNGSSRGAPHEALYWRFGEQGAIRKGDWKMVRLEDGGPHLYNLAADVGESNDLAASKPEKLKDLESDWQAWSRQLAAPKWNTRRATRGARKKARA